MEARKVLNQWEIDALLSTVGQPESESPAIHDVDKNVKPYDFRRPDKFSKDHLRSLQNLHEAFARAATSSLSTYLRMDTRIHLSSVEQASYDDYMQQLPNPTIIGAISMDPLPGRMILEMNVQPAFAILDRLLGGHGKAFHRAGEVTDIERSLLESLVRNIISSLRDAWAGVVKLNPSLDDLVLNPQVVKAATAADVVVLMLFEIRVLDSTGTISMCIPYTMLEPIMGRLGSQMLFSTVRKETDKPEDKDILAQLESVSVPVVVQIGGATVSVRELLGLQEGNVIRLKTSADAELPLVVGDDVKFLTRPGRMGKRLAVQVTRVLIDERNSRSDRREAVSVRGGAE